MKVLFAVNNENISESIIRRYQQEYKEIISAKNVYYFNAIIKELQRDKTYDRIVISEDLEPFSNNNYDAIEKFIFEKMDSISDEATNQSGNDIPIILICADRREKSEPLLVKLFGIGVYNALIGKDRSITSVCELLNRPRGKKEAKAYYRIDSDDVDYKTENQGDVSEVEIQNILNHYKKLGRNEEKYVESFDHIANQYTDEQLRIIAKFLPLNVKAVLEANSSTYQEVVSFGRSSSKEKTEEPKYNNYQKNLDTRNENKQQKNNMMNLDVIEKNIKQNRMTEPVIIPSNINTEKVKKVIENDNINSQSVDEILEDIDTSKYEEEQPAITNIEELDDIASIEENISSEDTTPIEDVQAVQPKRRGRPRKIQQEDNSIVKGEEEKKRGRGRPRKIENTVSTIEKENDIPPVISEDVPSAPLNLFELSEYDTETPSPVSNKTDYSDMILPGLDDIDMYMKEQQKEPQIDISSIDRIEKPVEEMSQQNNIEDFIQNNEDTNTQSLQNIESTSLNNIDLSTLLTRDKKIVAFVGTSKNGTSFLVNNLAEMLSQKGIKTAILDLTQNRNSYYIYTENEESLRTIAYKSIDNLRQGNPIGIQVNKNLTVYTALPGENQEINDYTTILETLLKNYSLILLDCDFDTNYGYFKEAQELYLVQSLDVLTIQPLTAFLRDLKAKNVLSPEKIRIALNKVVKVRSVSERTIIGGMAYYNDPAMSFMTELFNKDAVPYCSIPFEEQVYSKYLEEIINCKITLNGYSKNFMFALSRLANMVYPLIENRNNYTKKEYNSHNNNNFNNNFSNNMNDTLNKMKNNY